MYFSGALKCSVIWAIFFFWSWCVCYLKGRSLRCSWVAWGNTGRWAMTLYMGEGLRGSNGARSNLQRTLIFHSAATHNQTGPIWCWFPSAWACEHPRPLWVSPRTSPVRPGVSPAAPPTPTGVFNQRFEALFPGAGALCCKVCFAPRSSSGFICAWVWGLGVLPRCSVCPILRHSWDRPSRFIFVNVGPQGLLVVRLPAPFVPYSASLGPATATGVLSAPPTGLDECLFFISLVPDVLAVGFSLSSGCARRRSVSTYAAILVLWISFLLNYCCQTSDAAWYSSILLGLFQGMGFGVRPWANCFIPLSLVVFFVFFFFTCKAEIVYLPNWCYW